MKKSLSYVLWAALLQLIFLGSSFAFQMADYWPIRAGNVWIFNSEILAFSSNTQTFGQYNARKMFFGSDFCDDLCGNHFYLHLGSEGLLGVSIYEDGGYVDLSTTPVKLFSAEMQIGQSVVSIIPAGVLDSDPLTFTATLSGQETITVPAGTFTNALVIEFLVNDSSTSEYREKLWLAKGVGPVKIERVSESPVNHEGCFFSCGSFNMDTGIVVQREIQLDDFFSQSNRVTVIPLY
jgi:hypothetical protein